jgi:Zn-dependent metalloprotease
MPSAPQCSILPPYLLERLAQGAADVAPDAAQAAAQTLAHERTLRQRRELRATRWAGGRPPVPEAPPAVVPEAPPGPAPDRSVHDAQQGTRLPGRLARVEGDAAVADESVNEAYDGLGHTWRLLHEVFGRDSLDGEGLQLVASVHYGRSYDNAFWDGVQMVFGDGDGRYIRSFTDSVDVIAHELGHGLLQYTAGLVYVGQPGALNESVCDVLGSLVRQWVRGETAGQADWLLGSELFTELVQGRALRSLSAPGTAYDDPVLGRDPQRAHMDDYAWLPHDAANDNGGVHLNSGIPNKAFHLAATSLGGHSWERAGRVWFEVVSTPGAVPKDVDFAGFARATVRAAASRFGQGGEVETAVRGAWEAVGVRPDVPTSTPPAPQPFAPVE